MLHTVKIAVRSPSGGGVLTATVGTRTDLLNVVTDEVGRSDVTEANVTVTEPTGEAVESGWHTPGSVIAAFAEYAGVG